MEGTFNGDAWVVSLGYDPLGASLTGDQAAAIAEIEKLGGKVTVNGGNSGSPVITAELPGITDSDLASLRGLRSRDRVRSR